MQKHRIRLNKSESVNSVNKDNMVVVDLQQTTKPYTFISLRDEVDQYEIFKQERDNCQQYRLITTINPYCTNILFNPMTEIVRNEGSSAVDVKVKVEVVTDNDNRRAKNTDGCYGNANPNRIDMVRNTEYSRETIGYEYHPGMDIFNNHILRNTSFKIVNPIKNKNNPKFNTIEDVLRDYKGDAIKFRNRTSLNNGNPTPKDKHLYDHRDIMSITDAINNNLMEENGWFGFVNKSTIISKIKTDDKIVNGRLQWKDEDFNHIINNRESCEFIDMYPDRTLYSFNPKYNVFKHKAEYNWHVFLTYPYENFYNHNLIKDKNGENNYINALLIDKAEYTIGVNGENILMFHTLTKHNLKSGDFINIYWKEEGNYSVFEELRISNVGDLEKNNKDYYFYTTDLKILTEMGFSETEIYERDKEYTVADDKITIDGTEYDQYVTIDGVNYGVKDGKVSINGKDYTVVGGKVIIVDLSKYTFRLKHLINGYESEYYIRIFHKLPNLLKIDDKLTKEIANNVEKLKDFLQTNENFDKEQYQLAFSSTIYNDNKTQLTFTDGINIENLLDNRGRPVTEIYLTILKNNKGNKEWYKDNSYTTAEYSHCFSEVSCGFDLSFVNFNTNAKNSDVKTLNHTNQNGYNDYFGWEHWKYNTKDKDDTTIYTLLDIKDTDDKFIGDLVEFNITNCNEIVLEDCKFRFNSYMREHGDELKDDYKYVYDEITSDDYDQNGFIVTSYDTDNNLTHPEGYYYKAHYKIQLKEFSNLNQASHFDLKIKKMYLDSFDGKVILCIQTTLPHRLKTNELLLICDDERNRILKTTVLSVKDENTFTITDVGSLTCKNLYDILNNKFISQKKDKNIKFVLRRYNEEIPFYAEKYSNLNRYMWRDINTVGNMDNVVLPEYPFANGYFYINQDINFYLKRQDPFNEVGLYYDGNEGILPNDIFGNILTPTNYEYKEESEVTC